MFFVYAPAAPVSKWLTETLDLLRPLAEVGYKNVPDSKTAVLRTKFPCFESAKHGTAERDLHEK